METFSALLAICAGNSPVPGEFPTQRRVTRSFDVYFDLRPNKRLSKQSWGWWFEMLSSPLWRHRNEKDRWYNNTITKPRIYLTSGTYSQGLIQNQSAIILVCGFLSLANTIARINFVLYLICVIHWLQWRHDGRGGISNDQTHHCWLSRLFRSRWKKTSKLCVTGLCDGNSPVTGDLPAQRASKAKNVFIWWRHHGIHAFRILRRRYRKCW